MEVRERRGPYLLRAHHPLACGALTASIDFASPPQEDMRRTAASRASVAVGSAATSLPRVVVTTLF
jgi:hypothetical protein